MATAVGQASGLKVLKSVIFDMDGVIIDSHPAHRKAWHEFLLTIGKGVSAKELDFVLDGRKRHEILRYFLGDVSEKKLIEYGLEKDRFFQRIAMEVKPQPGVLHFIEMLCRAGITLALATSAGFSRTSSTLRRLNLTETFGAVVTGDDVKEGKPDSAIYRLACERLDSCPEVCVAIEDAESGIRAAKGAGLKCIGLAIPGLEDRLHRAGADLVIKDFASLSLTELQTILN